MAPSPPAKATVAKIQACLADLRDSPVDTVSCPESTMAMLYNYLMEVPECTPDGVYHWFCDKASPITYDAATFLLRLFAYTSPQVEAWKERLRGCFLGCCLCVCGFEAAKQSSKTTFFGAFTPTVLEGFNDHLVQWQSSIILECLQTLGISDTSSTSSGNTLSDAPSAIVYQMTSTIPLLKDPKIISVLRSFPPVHPFLEWPEDPIPPGMLMLLLDQNSAIRTWAADQIKRCKTVPIPIATLDDRYKSALGTIMSALSASQSASAAYSFCDDRFEQWSGFTSVIRMLPPEVLSTPIAGINDPRRLVIGHLHDTGPHFLAVLQCFLLVLKRLGTGVWAGEGPEYPPIVFDSVKDNVSFLNSLSEIKPQGHNHWLLAWFAEYLRTVQEPAAYSNVLAKMADFMCEELQHERFRDVRPSIMVTATRLLMSAFRLAERGTTRRTSVLSVLDIHSEALIAVAFTRAYAEPKWNEARSAARDLVASILEADTKSIVDVVKVLFQVLAKGNAVANPPDIRRQYWKKAYESLRPQDNEGYSLLIRLIGQSAYLDALSKVAFKAALKAASKTHLGGKLAAVADRAETSLDEVNQALALIRQGFQLALTKFANAHLSSTVLDLFRMPGVTKNVILLMLSPVDSIQTSAQTLVGAAFDVDGRLDCFRPLLQNMPEQAMQGLHEFLDTFNTYTPMVTEACSLSKSLVRCFTDIIEVLCASPDGLFRNPRFLFPKDGYKPGPELPKLWSLMAKSIALIFKRTPLWATYFESEEMIIWMRDALIFGRDMLAQRMVFETAANSCEDGEDSSQQRKKKRASNIGKTMMEDMQELLPELARWLRLTDEELLHQSFALLESLLDCFRTTGIAPSEAGLKKLNKHVVDARTSDPTRPQTRLDASRIAKLEAAIASFDDEDDVQIVSYSPAVVPSKPTPSSSKVKLEPKPSALAKPAKPGLKSSVPLKQSKPPVVQAFSKSLPLSDRKSSGRPKDKEDVPEAAPRPSFRRASTTSSSASRAPHVRKDAGAKGQARSDDTSSGSESEEEESQAKGLAALAKLERIPKIKKPVEARQVKMIEVPGMKKNAVQERIDRREEARRTALRLRPNITSLLRIILSWNYDHQGSDPPVVGAKPHLLHVPEKFNDCDSYRRVFEPLLIMECWAGIIRSKTDGVEFYESRIVSRGYTDDFLDLDVTITESVRSNWYLAETDIVLLRNPDGQKSVLTKTVSSRKSLNGIQATLRCFFGNGLVDPGLLINSVWRLGKVFSLTTISREYGALMALPYYDSVDAILRAQLPKPAIIDKKTVDQIMEKHKVNPPQATAIASALRSRGFTLIQGPPGTGKTATICALVTAFLSSRPDLIATPGNQALPAKVLICAPSNAAIDEVASRIKQTFRDTKFKVVRTGADQAIGYGVKDISLDALVDEKLSAQEGSSKETNDRIVALRNEIESIKKLKQQKEEELSKIHDNAIRHQALREELVGINDRRTNLSRQLNTFRDQQKSQSRAMDAMRRRIKMEVLQQADVICTTLSGSAHELLEPFEFEMTVIDEAAQAIELSALIPFRFRCKNFVLVGDPQQLPPTVISMEACRFKYDQSLFTRLFSQNTGSVHLLSIQYRMHPDISRLPSQVFYDGKLLDGPDMATKTKQPWHLHEKFGAARFFNVVTGREESFRQSQRNVTECQVAVALYARLRLEFAHTTFTVGVVTMYRAQLVELGKQFEQRFGPEIRSEVDFNTVDGFQGQEKDVIILSCVRAGPGVERVGFVADIRRMNVALTRAKSSLFILGNAATLSRSNDTWKRIVDDARSRQILTEVDTSYFSSPSRSITTAKLVKSSTSPQKTQAFPPPPSDLVTPRQFKADRQPATSASQEAHSPDGRAPVTSHGVKRRADDDPAGARDSKIHTLSERTEPASHPPQTRGINPPNGAINPNGPRGTIRAREDSSADQARPPVKRPKKAPNLFIPRKPPPPQKR
ncbi:hypothetical protein HGRIS_014934 [Hohenbuehelia grisea]|uniref:Uncharacterized protein n=1 Tax=Hohenbuehelia grisea TaxID=104357 RepID=A0ABR3K0S3_9AGAR